MVNPTGPTRRPTLETCRHCGIVMHSSSLAAHERNHIKREEGDNVVAEPTYREKTLQAAASHVLVDRNNSYGPPHQDFQRTADLWTTYLTGKTGTELRINAHDVAVMQILLKTSRLCWSPDKADHWEDIAGYAACGREAYELTKER